MNDFQKFLQFDRSEEKRLSNYMRAKLKGIIMFSGKISMPINNNN